MYKSNVIDEGKWILFSEILMFFIPKCSFCTC